MMKPMIVALDVDSDKKAISLIRATKKHVDLYKVGPTLVLRYGPSFLKKIRRMGKKIFLDLKFHDIPNTMRRSVQEAAKNGVYSATVHSSAGSQALKTVAKLKRRPLIWGVTVLTSMNRSDLSQIGVKKSPVKQVNHLGKLAKASRIDGIVASVKETAGLRKKLGKRFQIVTPGIRLPNQKTGDQKRVATPRLARKAGATFFVVGRPIIESRNPGKVAQELMENWHEWIPDRDIRG